VSLYAALKRRSSTLTKNSFPVNRAVAITVFTPLLLEIPLRGAIV
jgi:hypothetical protein